MSLYVATHDLCLLHEAGTGHPERPERLEVALAAMRSEPLSDAVSWVEAPEASEEQLLRVHPKRLLNYLNDLSLSGRGQIDPDTGVNLFSNEAARRAAGAGLALIEKLRSGEADAGWSLVRPPGHHALSEKQMGFCLINNVAVAAKELRAAGERVAIIDIDAHHGNGTQDIFYDDGDVLFVSLHQYPWYPYTGRPDEIGEGAGVGTTVNVTLPAGANGTAYRAAFDKVVVPAIDRFKPDWLLISAGFDGHRHDPLTDLGLTSTDYGELVTELVGLVPPGRRLLFLEGGYDLQSLKDSVTAVASALIGRPQRPEPTSEGGPGLEHVEVARRIHFDGGPGDR
ncbi:MAG: histone deacetylase [Acidimicrobiales bacterium]